MAYTYGKYLWKVKDTTGKIQEFKGVFKAYSIPFGKGSQTAVGNMVGIDEI